MAVSARRSKRGALDNRAQTSVDDAVPVRRQIADLLPRSEPVQILQPDGKFVENEDFPLDLKDEDFRELYRYMVLTRRLDKESLHLHHQGQLAVYGSCLGQEAAQVGSAYALEARDWVFPSYREHGVARVRGIDPVKLLHHSQGIWLSDHDPFEYRFAPQCIPIATHVLHATGFALGAKYSGADTCVVAYIGDGATSEGDFHEGLNFAAVRRAPCIFFIQNNGWAISVPLSGQSAAPALAYKGVGYGIPGIIVDGNDVLASYAVMRKALQHVRAGDGPMLIEALTYRMEGHSTSDDPTRYRTKEDLEEWGQLDPVARMEIFLRERDLWDDDFRQRVDDEATELTTYARAHTYDAPHGDPLEIFDHVYVEPPPHLEKQRLLMKNELMARES